jgi:hypothetical protein
MPFGLDLKSVIAGLLIAWFLIPMVQGFFAKRTRASAT